MVRLGIHFLVLASAALTISARVLPRAGTQFITGPCKSDVDCASDCCGFNTGKCAGPVIAQERDGGCGFGDGTPNNRAAQRIQGPNAEAAAGVPKAGGAGGAKAGGKKGGKKGGKGKAKKPKSKAPGAAKVEARAKKPGSLFGPGVFISKPPVPKTRSSSVSPTPVAGLGQGGRRPPPPPPRSSLTVAKPTRTRATQTPKKTKPATARSAKKTGVPKKKTEKKSGAKNAREVEGDELHTMGAAW